MAFRSSTTAPSFTSGTSRNTAVPSGAAAGDIALLWVYVESNVTVTAWPTGFTALTSTGYQSGGVKGAVHWAWKRLSGAETGDWAASLSGSSAVISWAALFSGRDTSTNPFDFIPVVHLDPTGTASQPTALSGTATAGSDAAYGFDEWNGSTSDLSPTGWVGRINLDLGVHLSTKDNVAAGTVSAQASANGSGNAWWTTLAVIKEASGPEPVDGAFPGATATGSAASEPGSFTATRTAVVAGAVATGSGVAVVGAFSAAQTASFAGAVAAGSAVAVPGGFTATASGTFDGETATGTAVGVGGAFTAATTGFLPGAVAAATATATAASFTGTATGVFGGSTATGTAAAVGCGFAATTSAAFTGAAGTAIAAGVPGAFSGTATAAFPGTPATAACTATAGVFTATGTGSLNGATAQATAAALPGTLTAPLPLVNGLTGDASTFEDGISFWTQNGNAVLAHSTDQAHTGLGSMSITATAAGNAAAVAGIPGNGVHVSPGDIVQAGAWFKAGTTARTCRVQLTWFDAAGGGLGTVSLIDAADNTAGWALVTGTATAPSLADHVRLRLLIAGPAAGEVHYVDDASVAVPTATVSGAFPGAAAAGDARTTAPGAFTCSAAFNGAVAAADAHAIPGVTSIRTDAAFLGALAEAEAAATFGAWSTVRDFPAATATATAGAIAGRFGAPVVEPLTILDLSGPGVRKGPSGPSVVNAPAVTGPGQSWSATGPALAYAATGTGVPVDTATGPNLRDRVNGPGVTKPAAVNGPGNHPAPAGPGTSHATTGVGA